MNILLPRRSQAARRQPIDYSMLIGGAWVESESGGRFAAESPATGETIGTVPEGTREDAGRAIAAAEGRSCSNALEPVKR